MKAYELVQAVKDIVLLSDATRDAAILRNLALKEWELYNSHHYWKGLEYTWTLTTVQSQPYLDLPATLNLIYSVRQTSHTPYRKLDYVAPQRFHQIVPQPTLYAETKPTHYTIWDNKLWLFPIPGDAYTLTLFGYRKPVGLKVYRTGSAAVSGTAVTGTSTAFATNNNVEAGMYFTMVDDVSSDGKYMWTEIKSVNSDTSLTLSSSYAGATSSGSYVCSSAPIFPEEFDLLLAYGAAMIECGRNRELQGMAAWLQQQYVSILTNVIRQQSIQPDYRPEARMMDVVEKTIGVEHYRYPFIKENP